MKPFFWNSPNFGDNINTWIWRELFPDLVTLEDNIRLVGIGTLIKSDLNFVKGKKVIFGSGVGYGAIPSRLMSQQWTFYFVRGPLTSNALGLDPKCGIVDGSWLICCLPEFQVIPEKSGIVFVPHWTSARSGVWQRVCDEAGLCYINPLSDSKEVIDRISRSRLAIVEAMHGAIIADYFRTPWIPVRTSTKILPFKWIDWCKSVGLRYRPIVLPPSDAMEYLWQLRMPRKEDNRLRVSEPASIDIVVPVKDVSQPHRLYSTIQRLKPAGRDLLNKALQRSEVFRDVWPIRIWNEKHISKLAKLLRSIAELDGHLSEDSVRERKIDQLTAIVAQFKADYQELRTNDKLDVVVHSAPSSK